MAVPDRCAEGVKLGAIELKSDMKQEPTEMSAELPELGSFEGQLPIFFKFVSDTKDKSLCTLHDFVFE